MGRKPKRNEPLLDRFYKTAREVLDVFQERGKSAAERACEEDPNKFLAEVTKLAGLLKTLPSGADDLKEPTEEEIAREGLRVYGLAEPDGADIQAAIETHQEYIYRLMEIAGEDPERIERRRLRDRRRARGRSRQSATSEIANDGDDRVAPVVDELRATKAHLGH